MREQKAHEIDQEKIKDELGGPWGGKSAPSGEATDEEGEKEPEPVLVTPKVEDESSKAAQPVKYVPPSMRNQSASSGGMGGQGGPRSTPGGMGFRKGRAPELDNKEEFPSLGDAPPPELSKDFVAVRHGARDLGGRGPGHGGPAVTLGNKFNALNNKDY